MSAVLNDRDAILQAAGTRIVNPKNADILLSQSATAFHVTAGGTADVASITVSATLVGLEGPLSWSVQGATLTEVTDRSATVTYANMQGATAIVTASMTSSGENFAKSCVLATIQDGLPGSSAKTVKLTPSEQVFKISKTGSNSPASITLTATGQNTSGTPSFTIPAGTATLTAGSSSAQKVLSFANMTTDQVTVEVTLDGQKDRVTIYKVREGQDGLPGVDAIVGLLTNESVTLPAGSNGTVSSFSGAVCTMKMYLGVTDDSANWAFAFSPASASNRLSYTTSGGTLTVTGMAAGVDSSYVDITATKTGAAAITKRFTVTKSKAGASVTGARGAGQYYVVGSAWSDVAAQAACPGDPVVNDQVTISNGTVTYTKRWDGAAWNVPGAHLDGDLFVERSINGSKLKVGTVEVTAPDGTPIVTIGGLQPGFEAPGTKNSDLDGAISSAASTAVWGSITGTGKPADNATVGAPAGTSVGGTLAETVASNAAAGKSASDALPGINNSLAGKLAAAGNQNLTGPVTLTSNGAVVVGTVNDGVRIGTTGIIGRKGGSTTFSVAADGTAMFGGNLFATNGTLGSLHMESWGAIHSGAFTGWSWPASGGSGFVLCPFGALFGNKNDGQYVELHARGALIMPGLTYDNKQLTLDKPIIVNPQIQTSFSANMTTMTLTKQVNTATYVSYTKYPTLSNGVGPYRHRYSLQVEEGDMALASDPTADAATIRARGSDSVCSGYLVDEVTDASGASAVASCRIFIQFGSGVAV